jgi:hypothetical protein
MGTSFTLDSGAVDFLNWLGESISECEMPGTLRVRVAASCLAIAQEHHRGIVALLDNQVFSSSLALLRCQFEAYIRGEWFSLCATDAQVESFARGKEPPPIKEMIAALEATPTFSNMVLGKIKANAWNVMCDYSHTGGLHIQRWGTGDIIEPSYSEDEIRAALAMAETFGALAVVGVAYLANSETVAAAIWKKVQKRFPK